MSMHLEKPALTTTSYKKRKEKITKAKQAELEQGWRDRNQRLKEMFLPKETFDQYMEWVHGRGKKSKTKKITSSTSSPISSNPKGQHNQYKDNQTSSISDKPETIVGKLDSIADNKLSNWITGPCTTKQTPKYTGSKILGIGILHKSCMQPIFSQEEAIDIARMRR